MRQSPRLIDWDRQSLALKAEPLNVKLKRLENDMINAEWDLGEAESEAEQRYRECRITAIDYELRMVKTKLEMGETHDMPF